MCEREKIKYIFERTFGIIIKIYFDISIMKKIRQTIKEFIVNKSKIIIKCNKYDLHFNIINGAIDFNFIDEQDNNIGLNSLNIDDDIIIFFREKNDNIIKPIKIIKLLKYEFNNDSESYSENYDIEDIL